MVAAISAFAGIIASIPAGMLSDRWGRRRMLIFAAIVFSTAPFLYLLVTDIWQLAFVRFYHGFGTALFIPVAMALVSDLFYLERGEKMGWFSTSTLMGRFTAPLIGGSIIGAFAYNPEIGFKAVYIVCGAAGLIVLLLALKIPAPSGRRKSNQSWNYTWDSFKTVLYSRNILMTSAAEASVLFAYGTFETFLPLYSIKMGLSAYQIGILLSAQVIVLALTKPAMGKFSDRHGRKPQIIAGALIGVLCIGSLPFFVSFFPLLILSVLFGLSLSIVTSATSALIADLSRRETHGSAMGILGSIMDVGHTTGPLVSGILVLYFGFKVSFITASVVLFAAAILFWKIVDTGANPRPSSPR